MNKVLAEILLIKNSHHVYKVKLQDKLTHTITLSPRNTALPPHTHMHARPSRPTHILEQAVSSACEIQALGVQKTWATMRLRPPGR